MTTSIKQPPALRGQHLTTQIISLNANQPALRRIIVISPNA